MTKATILSVEQTEKAGLFTIIFEGEGMSEFDNFLPSSSTMRNAAPTSSKSLTKLI